MLIGKLPEALMLLSVKSSSCMGTPFAIHAKVFNRTNRGVWAYIEQPGVEFFGYSPPPLTESRGKDATGAVLPIASFTHKGLFAHSNMLKDFAGFWNKYKGQEKTVLWHLGYKNEANLFRLLIAKSLISELSLPKSPIDLSDYLRQVGADPTNVEAYLLANKQLHYACTYSPKAVTANMLIAWEHIINNMYITETVNSCTLGYELSTEG